MAHLGTDETEMVRLAKNNPASNAESVTNETTASVPFKTTREKTIRDAEHEPIRISAIEQLIIDQPEFHRLHNVLQQSVAYLTYPSNRTSRFSHSLGATQIAGQLFQRVIENTPSATLELFLTDVDKTIMAVVEANAGKGSGVDKVRVDAKYEELETCFNHMVGQPLGVNHRPMGCTSNLFVEKKLSERQLFQLNVIWQAVRVATLLHDIGHLPLSHLFEHAIKEYSTSGEINVPSESDDPDATDRTKTSRVALARIACREQFQSERMSRLALQTTTAELDEIPFHEALGFLIETSFKSLGTNLPVSYDVTVMLAQQIIGSAVPWDIKQDMELTPQKRVLSVLHSIIAGELDADRLDYCTRDPSAAGIESAGIDVFSIINSASLALINTDSARSLLNNHIRDCTTAPAQTGHNLDVSAAETSTRRKTSAGSDSGESAPIEEWMVEETLDVDTKSRYVVAHHTRSLPAIEGFFHSRYRSFRKVASDHNAARFFAIVNRIILHLLATTDSPDLKGNAGEVRKILAQDGWFKDKFKEITTESKASGKTIYNDDQFLPFITSNQIVRYDDGWFRTSLANVFRHLKDLDEASEQPESQWRYGSPVANDTWALRILLDAFLNRRLDRVISVFKTDADVYNAISKAATRLEGLLEENPPPWLSDKKWENLPTGKLCRHLVEQSVTSSKGIHDKQLLQKCIAEEIEKRRKDHADPSISRKLERGVVIVHMTHQKIPPKLSADELPAIWVHLDDFSSSSCTTPIKRELIPAQIVSPALRNFKIAVTPRMLRVTIVGESLRRRDGVSENIAEILRDVVVTAIAAYTFKRHSSHFTESAGSVVQEETQIAIQNEVKPTGNTIPQPIDDADVNHRINERPDKPAIIVEPQDKPAFWRLLGIFRIFRKRSRTLDS